MTEHASGSRQARGRVLAELRRELMGPSEPEEVIPEFPSTRYAVGRLAPAKSAKDDNDAVVDATENDRLGAGADDEEAGADEQSPSLVVGFNPSSMGLSFLIDESVQHLDVEVRWGDYTREKMDDGTAWKRYPRTGSVVGVPVGALGKMSAIPLSPRLAPPGVTVTGVDDSEICIEGVVHAFAGYRAVSLFLVNRRTKGALSDRTKDERWIYQPSIRVTHHEGAAVFVAKDFQSIPSGGDEDGEAMISSLLYRHAREFATGHGVAASWDEPGQEGRRTAAVFTEFMPSFEVRKLIPPAGIAGDAVLDMKALAEATSGTTTSNMLVPLVNKYDAWIDRLEGEASLENIQCDPHLRDAAKLNIERCRDAASRLRAGLELLRSDQHVFHAFRFANRAMWDQRVHSIWAAANGKADKVSGAPSDHDTASNRTWRPFQMGFILLNLVGVADDTSSDRDLVDLLWFPTGGGKTEAYLGLAAFTLALRRLRGDRHDMPGGAGVSIIMRYTLRLLTVQQFQRAAALIAACEVIRRGDEDRWGREPFQIGLWVGRSTTPNTFADSMQALEDIYEGKKPREGSPVQLVTCPRCGSKLVDERGKPLKQTYLPDKRAQRTRIFCTNSGRCEFFAGSHGPDGLPVVVVDDEIYRTCPSLVVATVDKFARMPFKGETQTLFGLRNRYSPVYGHLAEAHGDKVGARALKDAAPASQLLPPDLIIQDELHLISGPLGTMVGLYETAFDYLSRLRLLGGARGGTKIIASTATIRRASQQVRQLYARKLAIFPAVGLRASDSFFAREMDVDEAKDSTAGRLYVGINAPGSSAKTLLVRTYSVLLASAQAEIDLDAEAADQYGTLVGYFNSLRALGGAKRLVEDDVRLVRLKYLARQRGLPRRHVLAPEELTSRIDSWRIPGLLKRLDQSFPRGTTNWPLDVLLATNMISVGVDIDRLGLMVVTGQPKTTSEYIQATSRVGRKHPGLVVTMYNWLGARDLSHYERFRSYHAALYRYVEAISVTPFSSRALDRGLRGVFAGMNRLVGSTMAREPGAQQFKPAADFTQDIVEAIVSRAERLVGSSNSALVRARLLSHSDEWAGFASDLLRYSWLDDNRKPPNNSRVLLRTAGTENEGEWSTPGSLREVEPTAAFFLDEREGVAVASRRAVGDVRPSQIVTSFGPGAVVDLQTMSIIVAGIDGWPRDPEDVIHEPRLQRALRVSGFHLAKPSEGSFYNRRGTVPAYIFPRYQVCPVEGCRTLSNIVEGLVEYDNRAKELVCKAPGCKGRSGGKRRAPTVPAPFIIACAGGHIDDFPWRSYVHKGSESCKGRLKLYSIGRTGSIADMRVECSCGAKRSMTNAFDEQKAQALGPCGRRQPWLGPGTRDQTACQYENDVRALQRGATNAWFPVVRSALAVNEIATPLGRALSQCDPRQLEKIDSLERLESYTQFEGRLAGFPAEEVWQALRRMRGEIETDEIDLRWPEWLAFRELPGMTSDRDEFYLETSEVPVGFKGYILRVVRARKLLEVRALLGFTRLEPPGAGVGDEQQPDIAPINRERSSWLPGVEVRGEGIFIELCEQALTAWEAQQSVQARAAAMADKFAEWERQRGAEPSPFPGPRYVLLHSFAHAMIRQLALDCGYSANSVRERIYSSADPSRPMAGVLLYTASPDSEGSLGGLVDLGAPDRFPDLLKSAIRSAARCSSDPLCADHQPDVHASINAAACHACLLVSETSCESFNRFLDRSVLAATMANDTLSFFPDAEAV